MSRDATGRHAARPAQPAPALPARVALALVHSNVWISLGAASLAVTTMALADLPLDPLPACLVFGATMVVYGVNRLVDLDVDAENVPLRAAYTRSYGVTVFAAGVALYLAGMAYAVAVDAPFAELLWAPPVVGVVYSLRRVQRRLLVKNLLVGAGWAAVPAGVGVYYGVLWTPEVLVLVAVTAASLTVAAMVFDVKDVAGDRRAGIRTVPNTYGVAVTRRAATLGMVAVGIGVVSVVALGLVPRRFLVVLVLVGYVATYSRFATRDRTPLFYGFVVDGEHVVLALAALAVT